MSTLIAYILLGLSGVVLLSALLALSTYASWLTGGHKRTMYWSKIFSGISYSTLGIAGFLSLGYLTEGQVLSGLFSSLFFAMGVALIAWGLKLRREANPEIEPKK